MARMTATRVSFGWAEISFLAFQGFVACVAFSAISAMGSMGFFGFGFSDPGFISGAGFLFLASFIIPGSAVLILSTASTTGRFPAGREASHFLSPSSP